MFAHWLQRRTGSTVVLTLTVATALAANTSIASGQCEVAKLTASDDGSGEGFGRAVAIDGDLAVVGPSRDGSAYVFAGVGAAWVFEAELSPPTRAASVAVSANVIVVGTSYDTCANGSIRCGSAYVYRRNGTAWGQEQVLKASDAALGDAFGESVSIDGEVTVVGAIGVDCPDGVLSCGAAYVFRFRDGTWVEEQKLMAPDGALGDAFSWSVSISSNVILVGAPGDDTATSSDSGSAYVFRFNGASWTLEQKLTASDAGKNDFFGRSVSLSGNYAAVGVYRDGDDPPDRPAAYLFWWNGTTWIQQGLIPSDRLWFGISVAIDDDIALVGAWKNNSVYVFLRNGTSWFEWAKLTPSDDGDGFGASVAVSESHVLVATERWGPLRASYIFRILGEPDCNLNTINDGCEVDCNANSIPDDCDIATGTSQDCTGNGIPDECEPDCNDNTVPDSCDVLAGTSEDCTGNEVPDECEPDCNENAVPDSCDIADSTSQDCNTNGAPDECDIAARTSRDANGNGIPDECETACCDPVAGSCTDGQLTCAEGQIALGAGTDCTPNCCEQPVFTGADDCQDAVIHHITVPELGEPPVVVTITGDNSRASGPEMCGFEFFEETGELGWWEAFEIDDCADVGVNLCCSPVDRHRPWRFITAECQCQSTIQDVLFNPGNIDPPPTVCSWEDPNARMFYPLLTAGTYYYPVVSDRFAPRGQYQMHITVSPCPLRACCSGSTCALLNKLECADTKGYFLGQEPLCGEIPDGSANPCSEGTCCTEPGICIDEDESGGAVDEQFCSQLGGIYTGGADCSATIEVCPPCDIEGPGNCQLFGDDIYFSISDLHLAGSTVADDFIPLGDTLTTVCTWGVYLNRNDRWEADCTNRSIDPILDPQDQFRIRVYKDGADDEDPNTPAGLPGVLLGEAFASSRAGTAVRTSFIGKKYPTYFHSLLDFAYRLDISDTPISGLITDGRRYWIEIANNLESHTECAWAISELRGHDPTKGGRYSVAGVDGVYQPGSERPWDYNFCLNVDFSVPPELTGACCVCSSRSCEDGLSLVDCTEVEGGWSVGDRCADASLECASGPPPNDHCDSPVSISALGDPRVTSVIVRTNTFCADTDGYNPVLSDFGMNPLGNDIWYTYRPDRDCQLTVSMCPTGTGYDSMIAIYRGEPGGDCPCPQDTDTSETTAFVDENGEWASDEGCTGFAVAGAGFIVRPVQAGVCYTIRVGGYGNASGVGSLAMRCALSVPLDPLEPGPNPWDPDPAGGKLNRVGGFKMPASADVQEVTLRVKIKRMYIDTDADPANGCPVGPDFSPFENQVRYLGPPSAFDDNDTVSTPQFVAAELQCTPFYREWSPAALTTDLGAGVDTDTIYYYGAEVVPCSVYEAQQGTQACVESASELCFSDPLEIRTALWGDVWPSNGAFGQVNFTDIGKVVEAFKGIAFVEGNPPDGAPRKVRAMLRENSAPFGTKINFADIGKVVDGFKTVAYAEDGPIACP